MPTTTKNFRYPSSTDTVNVPRDIQYLATDVDNWITNNPITINGTPVSLGGTVTITGLPSQTGNTGKYLTTNGSVASWATIDLSLYLTSSTAASTYLTISNASSTYAEKASPTLTGTPLAPTATAGTNTTQIATTAFVSTAVSNLVNTAPSTLDTLNELATALGNDANFSTTITTSISGKVSKSGGDIISASSSTVIPIVLKTASSQTADIQQWQDSASSVLAKVNKDGNITATSFIKTSGTSSQFLKADGSSDSTSYLSGTVSSTSGGTGLTSYSTGDIIYASATNTLAKLSVGSNGQFLTLSGGIPAWANVPSGFTNPMTAIGDIIIGGASGTATRLAAGTNGYVLTMSSGSPAWVAATSGYTAPTIGSTLIASGTTVTTIAGLTLTSPILSPTNASTVASVVKGASSQTANLQEWHDSSGNILAKVDASGNINAAIVYNINLQTATSYTFVLSDAKSIVLLSNSSSITASIPTNSTAFPIGSSITVIQTSAGQVTIQALTPTTTTVYSNASVSTAPKLRGLGSSATLIKISAEAWYVLGDLY